jgi:hypothetical protein
LIAEGIVAEKSVICRPAGDCLAEVAGRLARRIGKLMIRLGMTQSGSEKDEEFGNQQPLLAELYGASVAGRVATGPKAGKSLTKVGDDIDVEEIGYIAGPRCASVSGVNLHADVVIPAHDRFRLERLLRYGLRPPVAIDRLSGLPDGRLLYRLKRRWKDGTTHVIYEPLEFMEKLAALVPPPRFNLIRYSGLFAPSSKLRKLIVPVKQADDSTTEFHICKHSIKPSLSGHKYNSDTGLPERRYAWSELIRRVYSADSLKCARCGGRMRILCAINPPDVIKKILDCLGIPSRPPPIVPAILESSTEEYLNY